MSDISRQDNPEDVEVHIVDETSQVAAGVTAANRLKVDALLSENDTQLYKGKYISVKIKNAGSPDMNIDGSSTPVAFTAGPGSGKKWYVTRMLLTIEDENISHTKFGGIAGGLTNGVDIKITENGTERDLATSIIKTNTAFYQLCYDINIESAVTDILAMRWTFLKGGTSLQFKNTTSDNLKIIINDNLTSLISFQAIIQGYEVDE